MSKTLQHKLVAIMFTDIAGYTKAMSADEESALNLLKKKRSILKPLINSNYGTFVKEIGDGTLSHFRSVVDGATCAVKLQQATYDDPDMNLRIGVHVGDIIFDEDGEDVFGDGVNVAARLESMAPVGGVCVSKNVFEELLNKKEFDGIHLGLQQLKGVGRLIDVYALKAEKLKHPDPKEYEENLVQPHSDDEVPSVAVLQFRNKGKEEDAFYAYGITADLISDLSCAGKIRVAGMDDVESIESTNLSPAEIAKKLGVRNVVSGVLWKHGSVFQLSIEMKDTKSNRVVWSDRWQEHWEELPSIQGKLTEGLIRALDVGENERGTSKAIQTNTEAYEYYLRGKYKYEKRQDMGDTEIARGLFEKAIELDDDLLQAKNGLGMSYYETGDYAKAMGSYETALEQATALGDKRSIGDTLNNIGKIWYAQGDYDKALDHFTDSLKMREALDDKLGIGNSLNNIGVIFSRRKDHDEALAYHRRALSMREELGDKRGITMSLNSIGIIYHDKCDYDKTLEHYSHALKLKEELGDKQGIGILLYNMGNTYNEKGEYDKALDHYARSLKIVEDLNDREGIGTALYEIGNIYYEKGEYEKAEAHLEKSLAIQKEIGMKYGDWLLGATTYLFLSHKQRGRDFDPEEIHLLIKDTDSIGCGINLRIFELIEDRSFLETAYKQIKEKIDAAENGEKILNYPIPRKILEAWDKSQK